MSAIVQLVRILGSHPSDPGSSPGGGIFAIAIDDDQSDGLLDDSLTFQIQYRNHGSHPHSPLPAAWYVTSNNLDSAHRF